MSANKRWRREEAERVLDQIAESIEKGDAGEIAADLKESGQDVNEIASRTKAAALASSGVRFRRASSMTPRVPSRRRITSAQR